MEADFEEIEQIISLFEAYVTKIAKFSQILILISGI
jgi:hypothetical protein